MNLIKSKVGNSIGHCLDNYKVGCPLQFKVSVASFLAKMYPEFVQREDCIFSSVEELEDRVCYSLFIGENNSSNFTLVREKDSNGNSIFKSFFSSRDDGKENDCTDAILIYRDDKKLPHTNVVCSRTSHFIGEPCQSSVTYAGYLVDQNNIKVHIRNSARNEFVFDEQGRVIDTRRCVTLIYDPNNKVEAYNYDELSDLVDKKLEDNLSHDETMEQVRLAS